MVKYITSELTWLLIHQVHSLILYTHFLFLKMMLNSRQMTANVIPNTVDMHEYGTVTTILTETTRFLATPSYGITAPIIA